MDAVIKILGLSLSSLRFTAERFTKVVGGASIGDHRLPAVILPGFIAAISADHVRPILLED
jgi:hypothetical protein